MTTTCTVSFGSVTFTGAEIKEARLVEEINPLSIELPINTIELTLYSAAGDFSIINPAGFYATLQYKQPLEVYEDFNGIPVYMGRYYLDSWESLSANVAKFQASDAIGLLETQTYNGNTMPNGIEQSNVLIDAIETITGVTINLDASLSGLFLGGWIPVSTCREALQQICFTLGAYVTCARSNAINILPMPLANGLSSYDHTLTTAQIGMGQSVTLLPLVTGVQIDSHYWTTDEVNKQVFGGSLSSGDHRIFFDSPKWIDGVSLTGATNITTGFTPANYIDINVPTTGAVTIAVADFVDTIKPYNVNNGSLPAGTKSNIVQISDALLVSHTSAGVSIDPQTVAQRVYNYYQQRYLQRARFYALESVEVGHSILLALQSGWLGGIVQRMETDLTRGFITQAEIVGVIASTCTNILTAHLTVTTGNDQTYAGCLDMFNFNADLQGSANLIIT
jgi:hypothetical protein